MKLIQESAVGPSSVKGTPGKSAVLIYLDCQLVGENSKRPSTKLPNVEPAHLQKLVSCALRGRGSVAIGKGNTQVDCPVEGDIMVVCDGGRRDDIGLAPFKSSKSRSFKGIASYLEHWELMVILGQQSVKAKKMKNRGSINQVQKMNFISKEPLTKMIPERRHQKFEGTNRGNVLAFVTLTSTNQTWHTTVEDKKAARLQGFRVCRVGLPCYLFFRICCVS